MRATQRLADGDLKNENRVSCGLVVMRLGAEACFRDRKTVHSGPPGGKNPSKTRVSGAGSRNAFLGTGYSPDTPFGAAARLARR